MITMAEAGETLFLPVGEEVVIRLPEIGGTAFLWHLKLPQGFDLLSDKIVLDVMAPGCETQRELRLRSSVAGRFELNFFRYRPWETSAEADAQLRVSVVVESR